MSNEESWAVRSARSYARAIRLVEEMNVWLERDNAPFRFQGTTFSLMSLHVFFPGHRRDRWQILHVESEKIAEGEEEAYYQDHFQRWQQAYEKCLTEEEHDTFTGDSSGYNWFGGRHD